MRLYPAVWGLFRQAVADDVIAGQTVPAGTTVLVSQWLTQHDPRWFEEPTRFKPERWLAAGDDKLEHHLPKYVYFPFGGGPRICIGNSFALLEAQLLIAMIAGRYQLERDSDEALKLRPGITLEPRHPVMVRLRSRKTQPALP